MNKAELIDAVAADANLSKADAGRAVDAIVDAISSALGKGQQVSRSGRNPRTGETIKIAASNVPGFKAGKALKDAVN